MLVLVTIAGAAVAAPSINFFLHSANICKHWPKKSSFRRKRWNQIKNRYTDVLCFDHSRVVLSAEDEEGHTDYINANYVDGYKQKNAFISTQGNC